MNSLLQYKRRTFELSDGFYHRDCPQLFAAHDTITSLADCPFPLQTDSFKVILFGTTKEHGEPKYGNQNKFAVVEYIKSCGHLARERISFIENVADFEHYGTKFTGLSYSIQDWKNRIEYFRNYPCEVCAMVKHGVWCWASGLGANSRKKAIDSTLFLLDSNYLNWQEFVSKEDIIKRFQVGRNSQ